MEKKNATSPTTTTTTTTTKPKPVALDIDEMLYLVGDYHFFQKLILLIFFFSIIPAFFQLFITVFATVSPDWKCSTNRFVSIYHVIQFNVIWMGWIIYFKSVYLDTYQ